MKAEVYSLDITKLVNVSTGLNNLKTKVDDLDVDKRKTALVDLKRIGGVVSKEVAKNRNFKTKTK